jgi:predicted nucleotidyltransferase
MRVLDEQSLTMNLHDRQILLACLSTVRSLDTSADIILYGSRARGQAQPESDMDILVLLQKAPTYVVTRTIRDKIYDIGLAEDVVISVIVRGRRQWNSPVSQAMPFYKNVEHEGILIS